MTYFFGELLSFGTIIRPLPLRQSGSRRVEDVSYRNRMSMVEVAPRCSRRNLLIGLGVSLGLNLTFSEISNASSAPSGTTVINSVLSAYGLPPLKDVSGYTIISEQFGNEAVEFATPSSWLVQRNALPSSSDEQFIQDSSAKLTVGTLTRIPEGRGSPLTVGDYRRAEVRLQFL